MKGNASVSSGIVSPCPLCLCGSYHGDPENTESIRLGMPELALNGLSEGWLLRKCGSRHWSGVATYFQVPPERLEDSHGNRLYSSFLALRLSGSPISDFHEGDQIQLRTQLARLSRNRFLSRHRLSALKSGAVSTVEMISALLKRERTRDNTSLSEGEVSLQAIEEGPGQIHSDLAAIDKAIRNHNWVAHKDFRRNDDLLTGGQNFRYRYRPAPQCDFNGAGLLYFANYHSIVDRAEWKCVPEALNWTTAERDTFFFANINPGDQVDAVLVGLQTTTSGLRHRARLFRVSDGRLMAEVFTIKRGLE